MNRLLCLGLGYTARPLAQMLARQGWQVVGTSSSEAGTDALRHRGFDAFCFNGASPNAALSSAIAAATHILISIPPGDAKSAADPMLAHHLKDLLVARKLAWLGYLSTVGVYGDRNGGWVTEDDVPSPMPGRSTRRLEAENAWREVCRSHGLPVHIFRLAGIYGPGRSAIDNLIAGTARRIHKPGQVFNRIHVDDICRILLASIARPAADAIYNVTDDEPAPGDDVVAYAARLLGVAPPPLIPFEDANLSAMARSFYAENKRVSNARIKSELGVRLTYPSYREGLAAIAQLQMPPP